ncbi:MAG: hypothetical protein JSR34_12355 [Proteobacteria bacterium]|nr:hypothetical protein [Pseudomonadota bacterium]
MIRIPLRQGLARPLTVAGLAGALMLSGCTQHAAQEAAQRQAQAKTAEIARDLDTYRQALRDHNDASALATGRDLVQRFPNDAAAKEVQQTLPDIQKRWADKQEQERLAELWQYDESPMAGGIQSTAVIYDSQPSDLSVRLVLRRHTSWGQSVYLFGDGKGFVCKGDCTIHAKFDGKPRTIVAYAPPTGEPALMFRDDKGFIAALTKARKIEMEVTLRDGMKKVELLYEVSGFLPDHWKPLAMKGGKG